MTGLSFASRLRRSALDGRVTRSWYTVVVTSFIIVRRVLHSYTLPNGPIKHILWGESAESSVEARELAPARSRASSLRRAPYAVHCTHLPGSRHSGRRCPSSSWHQVLWPPFQAQTCAMGPRSTMTCRPGRLVAWRTSLLPFRRLLRRWGSCAGISVVFSRKWCSFFPYAFLCILLHSDAFSTISLHSIRLHSSHAAYKCILMHLNAFM